MTRYVTLKQQTGQKFQCYRLRAARVFDQEKTDPYPSEVSKNDRKGQ